MEITGRIIQIDSITSGTSKAGKDWKKQDFVIETQEQYPKKVAMSVMGDKVDQLSYYKAGYNITCKINIESREYNGRWYTSVNCWHLSGDNSNPAPEQTSYSEPTNKKEEDFSDLPF